jgi:hypothetical protein
MANQTKAKGAEALQIAGIPVNAFSIPVLCARNSISEGLYRKLRKRGKGARETRLLGRTIVTAEDEAAWLEALAAESESAAWNPGGDRSER